MLNIYIFTCLYIYLAVQSHSANFTKSPPTRAFYKVPPTQRILQSPPDPSDFTKSPRPRDFSWARTATLCCDQLNCPPIWAILGPWGAVAVVCRGKMFFIWEQIMRNKVTNQSNDCLYQCTFHCGLHNVYMYVNNLTGPWLWL